MTVASKPITVATIAIVVTSTMAAPPLSDFVPLVHSGRFVFEIAGKAIYSCFLLSPRHGMAGEGDRKSIPDIGGVLVILKRLLTQITTTAAAATTPAS